MGPQDHYVENTEKGFNLQGLVTTPHGKAEEFLLKAGEIALIMSLWNLQKK